MIPMAQKPLPRNHTIDQSLSLGHIVLRKKSNRRACNTAVTAEMIGWEV